MDSETDFDGSRRPYMRLWINDIKGSTADWTCAQFGAHMRMLMAAWERGHVPSDEKALRRICRDINWDEMPEVLERWRKVTMDGVGEVYINQRLERERERMMKDHRAKVENGRKGGQAKAKQTPSKQPSKDVANGVASNLALPYSHTPILPDSQFPDDQTPNSQVVGVAPRKRRAPDPLVWDLAQGFIGYTPDDVERWRKAYPLVDIEGDILRCAEHLRSRPDKWNTKNWRKRLVAWFARSEGYAKEAQAKAKAGRQRDESHIPDDVHPDDRRLFFSPEGKPRMPAIWRKKNGDWCI
jgi:uncharacterized protein YdaU (DUF1376 family)